MSQQAPPPPFIAHYIPKTLQQTGGRIAIAKNGVDTSFMLPPGATLPYIKKLGPESGQPEGTVIKIELEASGAPISRQQLRMDLGDMLSTESKGCLADDTVKRKIRDVREIISACDTLGRHGQHDANVQSQSQKVLKVVTVERSLIRELAKETDVQAEKGPDLVHACEISATESYFGGISRTIPVPGGSTYELDLPDPIEANTVLVYPGRGCQRKDGTRGTLLVEIQVPCVGGSDGARALGLDDCIAEIAPALSHAPAELEKATTAQVAAQAELTVVKELNANIQARNHQLSTDNEVLRSELTQVQVNTETIAAELKESEDHAAALQAALTQVENEKAALERQLELEQEQRKKSWLISFIPSTWFSSSDGDTSHQNKKPAQETTSGQREKKPSQKITRQRGQKKPSPTSCISRPGDPSHQGVPLAEEPQETYSPVDRALADQRRNSVPQEVSIKYAADEAMSACMFSGIEALLRTTFGSTGGQFGDLLSSCKRKVVQNEENLLAEINKLCADLAKREVEIERTRTKCRQELEHVAHEHQQMATKYELREIQLTNELAEATSKFSRRDYDESTQGSALKELRHKLDLESSARKVAEMDATEAKLQLQEALATAKSAAAAELAAQARSSLEQMTAAQTTQCMLIECGTSIADLIRAKNSRTAATHGTTGSTIPRRTLQQLHPGTVQQAKYLDRELPTNHCDRPVQSEFYPHMNGTAGMQQASEPEPQLISIDECCRAITADRNRGSSKVQLKGDHLVMHDTSALSAKLQLCEQELAEARGQASLMRNELVTLKDKHTQELAKILTDAKRQDFALAQARDETYQLVKTHDELKLKLAELQTRNDALEKQIDIRSAREQTRIQAKELVPKEGQKSEPSFDDSFHENTVPAPTTYGSSKRRQGQYAGPNATCIYRSPLARGAPKQHHVNTRLAARREREEAARREQEESKLVMYDIPVVWPRDVIPGRDSTFEDDEVGVFSVCAPSDAVPGGKYIVKGVPSTKDRRAHERAATEVESILARKGLSSWKDIFMYDLCIKTVEQLYDLTANDVRRCCHSAEEVDALLTRLARDP